MHELERMKAAIRRQVISMPWVDAEAKYGAILADLDELPVHEAEAAARTILAALTWITEIRDSTSKGTNELQ